MVPSEDVSGGAALTLGFFFITVVAFVVLVVLMVVVLVDCCDNVLEAVAEGLVAIVDDMVLVEAVVDGIPVVVLVTGVVLLI